MKFKTQILIIILVFLFAGIGMATSPGKEKKALGRTMAKQATKDMKLWTTADHTKFKALNKPFKTGPEITKACLSCHSEAEKQFHKTIHWTWIGGETKNGGLVGKAGHSLNNYCISANKMEDKGCMSCHPGWGNTNKKGTNCLVCHSQKDLNWEESFEDYGVFSESDDPEEKEIADEIFTNIKSAVQDIKRPTRKNCGSCHFYGGGGDGVKHGDLDSSLTNPNKSLDVHMGKDGQNFNCTRCHTTTLHNIAGRVYTKPAAKSRKSLIEDDLTTKITCESCHTKTPHKENSKANDHTDKVACQSCHIPDFARVNPTKMSWDWSRSGKLKDGKKYKEKGKFGKHNYLSIKGKMRWDKKVKPEYFWYNGSISSLTSKDRIDPSKVVKLSHPVGSASDKNSRIYPFKVHRGTQPYDKINNNLLTPLLSGPDGYWNHLDWDKALTKGMKAVDVPYSGKFDFVKSTYVYPITHMVAPKNNVVSCNECHTREESRLKSISGVYMPARDSFVFLDWIGWFVISVSFLGISLHGLGRVFARRNGYGKKEDK